MLQSLDRARQLAVRAVVAIRRRGGEQDVGVCEIPPAVAGEEGVAGCGDGVGDVEEGGGEAGEGGGGGERDGEAGGKDGADGCLGGGRLVGRAGG